MSSVVRLVDYRASKAAEPVQETRMQHGFVAIPTTVEDALLRSSLSKQQERVFRAILRKTVGYNKASDFIATTQLADMVAMDEGDVRRALMTLESMGLIVRGQRRAIGTEIAPNLDISGWNLVRGESPRSIQKSPRSCEIPTSIRGEFPPTIDNSKRKEEPPVVPPAKKAPRQKRTEQTMRAWLETTKAAGETPIPEGDSVFQYAEQAGIPRDFLRLCWCEFRDRHSDGVKTYKDWRAAFRLCVRADWYRLWAENQQGEKYLTTAGKQAAAVHGVGE
ncbi:replication protein [Chitinimonas arctica]|uniref:Replication protein n=1 Tax=Chitinimonas arctica TaxID=2594795 RepID=A0A516SAY3_9NEIS|nr:replication protein [Chitinimonas arctica]QDQ25310.1 replication protein [Chitinimonas arctica]